MAFEVVEQFVEAKNDARVCEDIIVAADNFVAVIDGASDATGASFNGLTGGRLAAEAVADAIRGLPTATDARTFADTLSEAVRESVAAVAGDLGPDVRWPVAVAACVSRETRQVWRVGDCNIVIGGVFHPGEVGVDGASCRFRAAVNTALVNQGMSVSEIIETDPGHKAARVLIDQQQHLANRVSPWGFGCFNGQRVPDEYLEIIAIPETATEVVLASDGYPEVRGSLAATEAALRALIERDPAAMSEMWAMGKPMKPGANAPDDRAYLRLTV